MQAERQNQEELEINKRKLTVHQRQLAMRAENDKLLMMRAERTRNLEDSRELVNAQALRLRARTTSTPRVTGSV